MEPLHSLMDKFEYLVRGNLALARGSLVCIEDGRGMLVYVWSGSVWITEERDRRDRIVRAGSWFRIGRAGLTVVSALEPSALTLTSPYEEGCAKRIDLVHARSARVETISAPQRGLAALAGL